MDAATWVDLAPLVDPLKAWLANKTGKVVTFAEAPKGGTPPFQVLHLISDPRLVLTLDGGLPVEITWQLDSLSEERLQALALHDKGAKAMVFGEPLPVFAKATVAWREALGDTHGPDKIAANRWQVQSRFKWTLIGATPAE